MSDRTVLLGIGGPVIGALISSLGAVPGLAEATELHLSPAPAPDPALGEPGTRPPVAPDLLARTGIVLAEAGALTQAERAALAPAAAVITLPVLSFPSLWPFAAALPARPGVPAIPAPLADSIARRVLQSRIPPADRRAAYDATDLAALADLHGLHGVAAAELFRREHGCDIRVAGFILARFRQERLFHGPEHPAAALLAVVMSQLLGHPALAAIGSGTHDARLAAVLPDLDAALAENQAPIHPAVAAHFGLAWWSPGLRYRMGQATRSFAEWVEWQLREPPALPPDPSHVVPSHAGPSHAAPQPAAPQPTAPNPAERHPPELHPPELHPAAEIARTAPFFATAIDPATAPHGAALLSPGSARYALPPTPVTWLSDPVFVGRSGAVLFAGSTPAGSGPAPQPSTWETLTRERIDAEALLAYGPNWPADPRGLVTLLPRLVAAAHLRRRNPHLQVLLPAAARTAATEEMLALLGLAAVCHFLPDTLVSCARLLVTGPLDLAEVSPLARQSALALAALVPLALPGPRRLYLRTAEAKGRLANEPLVAATLAALGVTLVDAETTTLAERIALLRHATAVIAPQSGALAELAFAPPGAAILELLGPADPSPLFWSLASVCGLRYGYIVGEAEGPPTPGSPYRIPLPMLEHALTFLPA